MDVRFFLVREAGLEFHDSGIYGTFETFILIKHVFCLIYPIISNWIFCSYPVKGSGKGKNKGNYLLYRIVGSQKTLILILK